jgi:hypothetical protein
MIVKFMVEIQRQKYFILLQIRKSKASKKHSERSKLGRWGEVG